MGSSAKKKRERKKDFQKPKLKVGKARPKAANQTDTSFQAKAIVLNQQSLTVEAPSATSQFSHHVSLLSSKSDSQRKDSLGFLYTYLTSMVVGSQLPIPTITLLTKLCPLILDGSASVRVQLLKLLSSLPAADIQDHAPVILPYVRAGMTHLSADIRSSTMNVLSWLMSTAGEEAVSCAGGWQKTLDCFVTMFGWNMQNHEKWSTNKTSVSTFAGNGRTLARNLQVLSEFIHAGIGAEDESFPVHELSMESRLFPMWHTECHMIPKKANAYGYLNLFGAPRDDDGQMLDDKEDRLGVFNDVFRTSILAGLDSARKEGGEPGRAAGLVYKAMKDARVDD